MIGYDRHGNRHRDPSGYERHPPPGPGDFRGPPPSVPRLSSGLLLVLPVVWSVLVWGGYTVGDVLLTWLTSSQGAMMAAGKDAGSLVGLGKEVGIAVDALGNTGLVTQLLALARVLLMPGAVIVWLLGAVLIFAAPALLRRFGGLMNRMRY